MTVVERKPSAKLGNVLRNSPGFLRFTGEVLDAPPGHVPGLVRTVPRDSKGIIPTALRNTWSIPASGEIPDQSPVS